MKQPKKDAKLTQEEIDRRDEVHKRAEALNDEQLQRYIERLKDYVLHARKLLKKRQKAQFTWDPRFRWN